MKASLSPLAKYCFKECSASIPPFNAQVIKLLPSSVASILRSTATAPVLRSSTATEDGEDGSQFYGTSRRNSGRDLKKEIPILSSDWTEHFI